MMMFYLLIFFGSENFLGFSEGVEGPEGSPLVTTLFWHFLAPTLQLWKWQI